jgi:tetratricopeptide (TPR) repeat protein
MPKSIATTQTPAQELRHFTDREPQRDTLRRLLTRRELPLPVVMFYGVGGAGKSWLLRQLRNELADDHPSLPTALLDLEPRSGGTAFHADSSRALAAIRQQFKTVTCPRFDLAYAWLRHREGNSDEPMLKGNGAAADAFEFVKAVSSAAVGIPGISHGVKKVGEYLQKHVFRGSRLEKWFASFTGSEDFLSLRAADPQQIYPELARRLLADLAENLALQVDHACRAVLFIDTFETLSHGVHGRAQRHERESWVRDLHATDSPVLLVLAGRDRLLWEECDTDYADPAYLEQHLVGGLSAADARAFLRKCGTSSPLLLDAILRVSVDTESESGRGEPGYHPFSLGLCADAVASDRAASRAVDPAAFDIPAGDLGRLAQRFLKSLPERTHEVWVRRLAFTPRFDEPAARAAFSPTPGAAQDAAWQTLLGFSFVQDADEPGWHTLHARMRDALTDGQGVASDHRFWQDYWRERSVSDIDLAASLAWYHGWCLAPVEGWRDWERLARRLRRETRMREHFAALDWWEPTGLLRRVLTSPDEARMLNRVGIELFYATCGDLGKNLSQATGCYEAALRVTTEAELPEDWAFVQNHLGLAYWKLPAGDRVENMLKALQCFQNALRVRTKATYPKQWARTQHDMGSVYWDAGGDRLANLRRSVECFEAALSVYTPAESPVEWASTQNNLGTTYRKLAELLDYQNDVMKAIERHRTSPDTTPAPRMPFANLLKAIACYQEALAVYTEGDFPREWGRTQDNLGTVYRMRLDDEWADSLRTSIECYRKALRVRTESNFPSYWADTNWNLGLALAELGELTNDPSHLTPAVEAFDNAERGYLAVGMAKESDEVRSEGERVRQRFAGGTVPAG